MTEKHGPVHEIKEDKGRGEKEKQVHKNVTNCKILLGLIELKIVDIVPYKEIFMVEDSLWISIG